MLEKIIEQDCWEILSQSDKPVVMYGMGDGALKIFDVLKQYNIEVAALFASDEFVRGHSFNGYKVLKYGEVCAQYPEFNVIMAFAIHDDKMLARIQEINAEHEVFAPDVPVAGGGLFTRAYIAQHEQAFDQTYALLADELSRQTYIDVLNFKVSGKVSYLYHCQSPKSEVYTELFAPSHNEVFVDLGAYDGDTIAEFLSFTDGAYDQIIALEPDSKNFKKLEKNTAELANIQRYHMGAWNKKDSLLFSKKAGRNSKLAEQGIEIPVHSVDNLINHPITILKMDIEGSEAMALEGAQQTIQRDTPKLYVCAYHRNEDLFALPLQIHAINPNYRIHLRHHPYIPAWETNFYCI